MAKRNPSKLPKPKGIPSASTEDIKSPPAAPKTARPANKKTTVTDLMISQELPGDPRPLSYKRYPGDFFTVILSDGRKRTYGPDEVQAAIEAYA